MNKRVAIGDMVYLTTDREGIVRFKGKTGFGLGVWFGIEIRTQHKTRHDGLIHGKRYFRCPRNKGLFVRKQIIKDVMDKKTAEQKTRVFKFGGTRKKNRKIKRKYNQPPQTKKKANKKQKKVNKNNNKIKKTQIIKSKEKPPQPQPQPQPPPDAKEDEKQDEEKEKEKNSIKPIIKINKIEKQADIINQEEKKEEKEEETKDFSSKESFSNPKSRKYFGADQVFIGLDRRRSKYEDILLIDPNSSIVHQQNDQRHKNTKLGTKRRKSKKKLKAKNTQKQKQNKATTLTNIEEENEKKIDEPVADIVSTQSIPETTSDTNNFPDTKKLLEVDADESKSKVILSKKSPLSPQYSPFMSDSSSVTSPSTKNSKKYRPFGGDTSPKAQLSAPVHIKQISMEFIRGNLKAKLKKVVTTKRKKRNGTIRHVYEKYATKADYPKLDDLRNETLVSEFLSFELYNVYRDEVNIINDYTIDRAIECGCFYLPDPIGFRLADFKTYEVFQDICDELLSILHDEWNPKDRPHQKNTDWRLLITMNMNVNMGMNVMSKDILKRSKSPNPYGYSRKQKRRSRGLSLATTSSALREKRKKSKRRKNTSGTHNIGVSMDIIGIAEETEMNMLSTSVSADEKMENNKQDEEDEQDEKEKEKVKQERKRRKKEDKRRKSHKRQRLKESSMNSSFMMARLQLWDNDYVSSCRITLSRNLHGFRFSNVISRSERRNLEKMLSSVLSQCNEGALKGRYRPYHKINASKLPLLIETDKLFPKPDAPGLIMAGYARDWPQSRGIFINNNKNLYIWCNYLEHLHLISVQNDGNILQAFKRLFDCEEKLESLIKQRQQIFLDNVYKQQQDILSRELQFNNNNNNNPPIKLSRNISIESPTQNNEQMLVSETPDSPNNGTFTFTDVVKKQEKKEKKGLRLTRQEYRIKKMNFSKLYSEIGFVFDDELGYISSNPQYFGTSMRVYVTVKLPNLICHEKFNDILEIRNLTAYQHDVDSAQQMFMAYASQLPSNKEVRQRRNSTSNPSTKINKNPSKSLPKLAKITKIEDSQTTPLIKHGMSIDDTSCSDSNDAMTISVMDGKSKKKKKKGDSLKLKKKMKEKEDDFMSNLNLPEISNKSSESENDDINEPKVPLATLTTSMINNMNKHASVPIGNYNEEEKEKEKEKEKELIHDDEDLGDVVNPLHYKEEITIYQTTSLGISEVDQVKNMVEAINCLIEMEKLLSAGNKLDERIKAEKLKKTQSKFKK